MSRSHRTFTAVIAAALALGSLTALGASTSADAATSCTDADPAPVIEDISNIDAAPGARSRGMDVQSLSAMTDNRCARGGSYDCSLSTSCTNARFSLRRSSATTVAARRCAHTRTTEDDGQGVGPETEPTTTRPTVYSAMLHWTIAYDDGPQPAMHNACAGAWDLTAVVTNTYEVDGQTRSRSSEPFTRTRAFFVRRESRVTADAGPEPVRRGGTVTIRGRLTRANWDTHRWGGYAGQRVKLQRRPADSIYYRTIRTLRTDRYGRLLTRVRATSADSCYRWLFEQTTTATFAVSGGDCVRTRR